MLVEHKLAVPGKRATAIRRLEREETVTRNRQIQRICRELNESLTKFLRDFFQRNTLTHNGRSTLQRGSSEDVTEGRCRTLEPAVAEFAILLDVTASSVVAAFSPVREV